MHWEKKSLQLQVEMGSKDFLKRIHYGYDPRSVEAYCIA